MRLPKLAPVAVTVVASGLLLTACGNDSSAGSGTDTAGGSGSERGEVNSIFFANPLPAYPDWAAADSCFKQALKDNGVEGTSQGPTGLQIQDQFVLDRISQATTSGQYDAIMMTPIQAAKYEPFVKRAKDAGMYVATILPNAPVESADLQLGTDLEKYGADVAEAIGQRPGQQNVIVITDAAGGIGDTIVKEFEKNLPSNVKVVATGYDAADPTKTADVVGQSLTAHPEANVVWTWEGTGVAGITTAIKEKGLEGEVVGVTNDLTDQSVAGIRDGLIYGTMRQHFCDMGRLAVENLLKLGKGEEVPATIDTGTTFVTKDNVDQELADAKKEQS
jgi:ABC-type sugar transport system substrate-binding protein